MTKELINSISGGYFYSYSTPPELIILYVNRGRIPLLASVPAVSIEFIKTRLQDTAEIMEFVPTPKGGRRLILDGFAYLKEKNKNGITYWRCERRKECPARCSTMNDVLKTVPTNHTHAPNPSKILADKTKSLIIQRALSSDEATSSVFQNVTSNFPLAAVGSLPSRETLKRMVRRKRKINEEAISESLQVTPRGEEMLTFTDVERGVYVITTETNLNLLSNSDHWFADGTFDCAPENYQLYTIHALFNDASKTVPLVFCILDRKDEASYNRVFELLKERAEFHPQSIMIDYEMAALNSLILHFPNALLQGCLFHFGQCIWRKIQALGLQNWYQENDAINQLLIKQFRALAFVPPHLVVESFNTLVDSLDDGLDNVLSEFLVYFETTWIGILQRGRRRPPMFSIDMWNVYDRVQMDLPRTNNSVEGWHNAFNKRVGVVHPSPRKLFMKIRQEIADFEILIEQHMMGVPLEPSSKRYRDTNERIKNLVTHFDNDDIITFLRGIAHNLGK